MRLFSVLLSALSLLPVLASAGSTAADKKLSKFTALVASSKSRGGLIDLTDSLYDELTTGSRNFTAVVLLTALEARIGCQLCREFAPEFDLLAKSWNKVHKGGDGLFFAELDFANAKTTFQKVCPTVLASIGGRGTVGVGELTVAASCNSPPPPSSSSSRRPSGHTQTPLASLPLSSTSPRAVSPQNQWRNLSRITLLTRRRCSARPTG